MSISRLDVFTVRLPAELRDALDAAAAADHRSTSALIRKILIEWLRAHPTPKGPRIMKKLAAIAIAALMLQALPAAAQSWQTVGPGSYASDGTHYSTMYGQQQGQVMHCVTYQAGGQNITRCQ